MWIKDAYWWVLDDEQMRSAGFTDNYKKIWRLEKKLGSKNDNIFLDISIWKDKSQVHTNIIDCSKPGKPCEFDMNQQGVLPMLIKEQLKEVLDSLQEAGILTYDMDHKEQ